MMMTSTFRRHAANGFTLIELLIVVIIIAILAAIAIPQFSSSSSDAQEAALDANLSTMRSAIELYRVQHKNNYPSKTASTGGTKASCDTAGGALGTSAKDTEAAFIDQLTTYSNADGATCTRPHADFPFGPYLREIPKDPIKNVSTVAMDAAAANPTVETGGWVFSNVIGKLMMNSKATGRDARAYYLH
jgi:prepilin-type N-terminal cleavage/methylation domain-containing protein